MSLRTALPSAAAALRKLSPRRRYLVALSGGRDSVVLFHLLLELGFKKLIVCHLDHSLRGPASRADERFVKRLAARHHLVCVSERIDVRALAGSWKYSLETAAREARYEFFARTARRERCQALFLGHHADDRVETFLFNLLRGSGRAGLPNMRESSERKIDGLRLTLLRPLLGQWRREIDSAVQTHRLKYREDSTNAEHGPRRNLIRHEVLPALGKWLGRDVRPALWRTSEILSAEEDWLATFLPADPLPAELSVKSLRALHPALQRRIFHRWLKQWKIADAGFSEVESVRRLLHEMRPARINLPGGRHVRRRSGKLFLED